MSGLAVDPARPGRLLVLGYAAVEPPEELFRFAAEFGLGGVILFRRNCPDANTVHRVIRATRERLRREDPGGRPLFMVDQEGGRVERIRDGVPSLPSAAELWAQGEGALTASVAAQARALRDLGLDVNLAPVCDVAQPGESGAIGDRAYGTAPEQVGRAVATHVAATLGAGLLCCAKHFPGHGAAGVDSHRELPRLDKSREELEAVDLPPFRTAVAAGVPLVMPGHLLVPAVSARPACLSTEWLQGVLRGRLGFRGVVLSDDMEMGALAALGSPAEVAVSAVTAGCDLLIYGRMLQPQLDVGEVARALARGVSATRLEEARTRVGGLGGDLR